MSSDSSPLVKWLKKIRSSLNDISSYKLVGVLADNLIGALYGTIYSTSSRLLNVEEDAGKLRRIEERIRALLTDAEQRRSVEDDSIKLWLQELRAVAFDVDTLLDRLNTMTAVSRAVGADPSRKRKWLGLDIKLDPRQRGDLSDTITKINGRLDEISEDRKKFRFRGGDARRTTTAAQQPGQRNRFLEAAARCDERPIGRIQEKAKIITALVSATGGGSSSSNSNPVVLL